MNFRLHKEEEVVEKLALKGEDLDKLINEACIRNTCESKYEKSMQFQLKKATVYLAVIITFNMILPIYQKTRGLGSISQYLVVAFLVYGYLGQLGYIRSQPVPILPIMGVRFFQIFFHSIFTGNKLDISYLFLVGFDIFYYVTLYVYKSRYQFKSETIEM